MAGFYVVENIHRNGHRESMRQSSVRYRLPRLFVYSSYSLCNSAVCSLDYMVECLVNNELERTYKDTVMA